MSEERRPLSADTYVLLDVSGSANGRRQLRLGQVARELRQQKIPATARLQMAPGEPLVLAIDVVGDLIEFQPTRAALFAVSIAALPVVLVFLHFGIFGLDGIGSLILVALGAGLLAYLVLTRDSMRTKTSAALARTYGKNYPLLGAAVALLALTEAKALQGGLPARQHRRDALAALDAPDPCAILKFDKEDFTDIGKGSAFDSQADKCQEQRRAEREMTRVQHCQVLVERVQQGKLLPVDELMLGSKIDLVQRITNGALDLADLKLEKANLPCDGKLAVAFASAAARSTKAWAMVDDPSNISGDLVALLGQRPKPALAEEAAKAFQAVVEGKAERAVREAKLSEDLSPAKGLCNLGSTLLGSNSAVCKRATTRAALLERQETAAAAAKDAADAAKERICASVREQNGACALRCMDRFGPDDPRGDACGERCDARFKASGCE